jgi:hypothetical protein
LQSEGLAFIIGIQELLEIHEQRFAEDTHGIFQGRRLHRMQSDAPYTNVNEKSEIKFQTIMKIV